MPMASVLNLSQRQPTAHTTHLLSDMEPLSLSLDLSLGGLFSKHNDNFQALSSRRSLKTSQSPSSFPVEEVKACPTPSMIPVNSQWDVPASSFNATPLPVAAHERTTDHFEAKSLQAQIRRHEARKRRKSIIEGKLQKRAKGDSQEELTCRLSSAHYLVLLTPPPCDEGKLEKVFTEEAGKPDRMSCSEGFMCKNRVLASGHPESILPLWVKNESATDECGHAGIPDSGTVELNDASPVAMVDFMNLLGCEKHAPMGMGSTVSAEARHDVSVCGEVSSTFSLPHGLPLESMFKRDRSLDAKHGSDLVGDVLSSTSSGFSYLTSCMPESQQTDQPHATFDPAYHSEVTIPTCGSSSQLLSWNAAGKADGHINIQGGDNIECIDKSCNSSSSETENEYVKQEQGNHNDAIPTLKSRCSKELAAEPAQPTVTVPAIYPHPFTMMPYSYPYGVPLPWGFSLPWYNIQSSSQKTFSMPLSSPLVEQSKEASTNPFGGYVNPYRLPSPWLPVAPPGVGTCTQTSTPVLSTVELSKALHPGHKGQRFPDFGQDLQGEDDSVLEVQPQSFAGKDGEDNVAAKVQGESVQALQDMLPTDEPLKECSFLIGDGKSSANTQIGKQPVRGHTNFEKHLVVGRQQSVPLANERVSKKKKKVVRFNSIDGAGVRVCKEAFCSDGDGNERISSQQFVSALDRSTQTSSVPSTNTDLSSNEVNREGSCDVAEDDIHRINSNLRAGDKFAVEYDPMHSNNYKNVGVDCENDGDMQDHENMEGDSNVVSHKPLSKSPKDSSARSKSVESFWRVTTHGSGPHGKTIHGVLYMTEEKLARLICVCHGKLMSPLQFVQHSGSSDLSNPERSIVIESFSYVDHCDILVPA